MLETDEALSVSVTAAKPFTSVKVKPLSKNVTPEISDDGVVSFTLPDTGYYSVEFDDMHEALFIFADAFLNYSEEDKTGDNVIYFGKGIHEAGKIELKSNQTLFIDEGAVVFSYIDTQNADNIKIIVKGILDGIRTHEKILYELGEKEIYGVVFRDIDIIRTTHGACTVTNVDYADIHDCVFEDIRVEYDDVSLQPRTQTSEDEAYFYDAHSLEDLKIPSWVKLFKVIIIYSSIS